jgi:hypothetical protein
MSARLALGTVATLAGLAAVGRRGRRGGSRSPGRWLTLEAVALEIDRIIGTRGVSPVALEVDATPEAVTVRFRHLGESVGYFRVSTFGTASWQTLLMPADCRAAWEDMGRPRLWIVRGSELYDERLRGKGLGRIVYEALLHYVTSHGGWLAPGRCSGSSTSADAQRVWRSLRRAHEGQGPLLRASAPRGSSARRPWSVMADLSVYADYDALPGDLSVLRLPDGQVLSSSALLDVVDGEADSELGWMLFQYGDGARAQERLEKLARWLDGLGDPLVLWRGLHLRVGEPVRRDGGNRHWTPAREIALAFAWGTDWGPTMPQQSTPGMRPVLLRAVLRDPAQGVDWVTTAHWFLGAIEDPELEIYLKPQAARELTRSAQVIEDP